MGVMTSVPISGHIQRFSMYGHTPRDFHVWTLLGFSTYGNTPRMVQETA